MTNPRTTRPLPPDGLLLLPHLRVQNANAISSPLTWGFPAPTAFLGFVHALERRLLGRFGQRQSPRPSGPRALGDPRDGDRRPAPRASW